jgi:hypothetical protein
MATADSAKKVARAAKAGGGPTRSQRNISWGYYGSLIAVAVVGLVAIIGSSIGRSIDDTPPYAADPERSGELERAIREAVRKHGQNSDQVKAAIAARDAYARDTHWHMAYAFYDCSQPKGKEWLTPMNGEQDPDPRGIHAHDDGLIHIHPFVQSASGKNAVMNEFFKATGLSVNRDRIKIPAKDESSQNKLPAVKERTLESGTKCSDGSTGIIRAVRFDSQDDTTGSDVTERIQDIRLKPDQGIVFALAPKGRTIPAPPSMASLAAPSDLVAPGVTPAGGESTSDSAGGAATTVAGAATTTAAGTATTKAGSATTVAAGAAATSVAPSTSAAP